MPTLEELEQRVTELERLLPTLSAGRTPEFRELEARVYEQIDALRLQLAEQRRRVSEQGQALGQRLDTLEKALSYQFNAFQLYVSARFDEQTSALRAQFENTNMPLMRVVGLVDHQEKDIREMKADISAIKERVDHLDWRLDRVDQRMESGFEAMDKRFSTLEQSVNNRFEATNQQMNERFDQVIALLSQRGQ